MNQKFLLRGIDVVAVGEASLLKAQQRIKGCAACSTSASRSFESLLYEVLGNTGSTEYFLAVPTECPRCSAQIFEKTLIDFYGKAKAALDQVQYFDSRDEDQDVVFVDEPTLIEAQGFISACEHCSDRAEIAFDQLLDAVTGCDPTITEYVICHAARCSRCSHSVMEKTLVVPR